MTNPCEYCGHDLPVGVDKKTRQMRSRHFEGCKARLSEKLAAKPVAILDHVICPNCTHQFRAIPVNVQQLMLDAGFEPPFTTPPQRTWVGLTEEEKEEIALEVPIDAVRITEAKLKEKNT